MASKIFKSINNLYELYEYRAKNIRLTWCKQVLNIIEKNLSKKYSINDFGCNYFQFFKEIKISNKKKKIDYFGIDRDATAIKIGLKNFPELKNKYKICDIGKYKPPMRDVSIISATLEHTDNPKKILNNMLNSTKKLIIIRTFVGNKNLNKTFDNKKIFPLRYKIRQFSKKYFQISLNKKKFKIQFFKDKATNNSKSYFVNGDKKFQRTMYIILGTKKN